ncbi:MAG TPA: ABC transporter permease [Actinomycetota bacterium]|nr:ABC transporter permease [Actinomycetota bacterium]
MTGMIETPRQADATTVGLEAPAPPAPRDPRKIKWARRRRAFAGFWRVFRQSRMGMVGLVMLGVFILVALMAPLFVGQADLGVSDPPGAPFQPPSLEFPLGTDDFGRSVLDLVIWGSRISLLVGFAATVMTMVVGAAVGISSAYYGGRTDSVLNAFTNWFLVIPWIPLAIVLASILGQSLFNTILVIGLTSWAGTARLVRADTLSVKQRPYVERARALGASNWHLVTRHILPNVMPVIFANTVLTVALSILAETTLALLGLGDPLSISWGIIIFDAFDAGALSAGLWWWLIPPGVCICLVTLAFTMCGYAIDEVLNPRIRER